MKTSCCHSKKVHVQKDYVLCMNEECENFMLPTVSKATSKMWNNIFAFFFFLFFFVLSFDDFSYNGPVTASDLTKTSKKNILPLTEENLRRELDSNHIICQEQVYAQIMIESGHLNSYLSKRANNLLGMRFPFKRKTSAVGIYLPESNLIIKGTQQELKKYRTQNHYAVYENWQDCVKDYKYWQDQSIKLTERYLTFLGENYAEDPAYIAKIKSMSK